MPGNKKTRRKAPAPTGTAEAVIRTLAKARKQKQAMRKKRQDRCDYLNSLPMSHPMSQHMIEKTMAPLYRFLEQHETKGGYVIEDGEPVLWDGKDWIQVISGILHMCFIYEKIGQARTWPKMPPGLRVYALGLQMGRAIDADDFAASRETIAWMEKWMGTVTPLQWRDLFDWATALDEKAAAAA